MEFETLLGRRRMVRSFKETGVEDALITRLLRNARKTPSAGFLQQQEFIVVKDRKRKEELAEAALGQDFVAQAPVVIVVCSNTDRVVKRYGDRGVNFYSIIDGTFASMLILLTAANEGLGACFIGAFRDGEVSRILDLPKSVKPIGIIPVGHADEPPEKLERRPLGEMVYHERYGRRKE